MRNAILILTLIAFGAYVSAFKILDRDFWWHITAGKIIVQNHALIRTEPFAYARAGLPYLANHEWLAQVALYLVQHAFGFTGIIMFRTLMALIAVGILLCIDTKRLWPNIFLAGYALVLIQPGLMDRPQLFTFVLLSAFICIALCALDTPDDEPRRRNRLILALIPLQILWVNLHGLAALLGIGITGAYFIERLANIGAGARPHERRRLLVNELRFGTIICATLFACLFVTPPGVDNIAYMNSLLHDKTIAFIGEWRPQALGAYAAKYAPLWILLFLTAGFVRKNLLFCGIVIGAMGYLSRSALRHEMLFTLAGTGIATYQLKHWNGYRRAIAWVSARRSALIAMTTLLSAGLGAYAHAQKEIFAKRDQVYGYGTFDLARGAYDFLERNDIRGNMFNTYGIGGYLIYRGYPARPVYIDGRNVDYGFDFMMATYAAQENADAWAALEKKYSFDYAIVDYDAIKEPGKYPFVDHLAKNPSWQLTYLDDWAAVYLKKSRYGKLADALAYRMLTPQILDHADTETKMRSEKDAALLETELMRASLENPDGVKARMRRAELHIARGDASGAQALLLSALHTQPYRPELSDELAFTRMQKAPATQSLIEALQGSAEEATSLNDRGVEAAEKEEYEAAEKLFLDALKIDPRYSDALNNIGNVYLAKSDYEKARNAYRAAIKERTDYAEAHYNLAIALYRMRSFDEALAEAEKAQALKKDASDLIRKIRRTLSSSPSPLSR